MKRQNLKRSALLAGSVLLLCVATLGGLTWRTARQEKLNQALMVAIQHLNVGDVQSLLKQGADPNTLHQSQQGSIWQIIWRRMRHTGAQSASANTPNAIQYTFEAFEVRENETESNPQTTSWEPCFCIVRLLIEAGASAKVSISDVGNSSNLLSCAIMELKDGSFKQEMLRFLLQHRTDVDGTEGTSDPPLFDAIYEKDEPAIKILLEAGANVNHRSSNTLGSQPVLYVAAAYSSSKVLRSLIDRGAQVNEVARDGGTPLMNAISENKEDNALVLLAYGANINAQNNQGNTALILACEPEKSQGYNTVCFILKQHPRLNIKNHKGQTALVIANKPVDASTFSHEMFIITQGGIDERNQKRKQMVRLLKQAGATE